MAQIDQMEIATLIVADGEVSYIYSEDTTLTDQQKADIEGSGISQKPDLPPYVELCERLRADDPNLSDLMVRTMAQGASGLTFKEIP